MFSTLRPRVGCAGGGEQVSWRPPWGDLLGRDGAIATGDGEGPVGVCQHRASETSTADNRRRRRRKGGSACLWRRNKLLVRRLVDEAVGERSYRCA